MNTMTHKYGSMVHTSTSRLGSVLPQLLATVSSSFNDVIKNSMAVIVTLARSHEVLTRYHLGDLEFDIGKVVDSFDYIAHLGHKLLDKGP